MSTTQLPPTDRQLEILDFLRERSRMAGPTVREVMQHFGFKSVNGAMCHLVALERKGLIVRHPGQARGIEVTA
jgi:repressor LexA